MLFTLTDKIVKLCCFPKLFQLQRNKQNLGSENLLPNGELKRIIFPRENIPKLSFRGADAELTLKT